MIIYCAIPIRGDKTYAKYFGEIIKYITSIGHTALSELHTVFKPAVPLTDSEIFIRDIKWIEKSTLLIAEVSGASTGVGFEIAYALYNKNIPVLALANKEAYDNISAMINGCNSRLVTVKKYENSEELKKVIAEFIKTNDGQS